MAAPLPVTSPEAAEKFQVRMKEIQLKEKEREVAGKAAVLGVPYINLKGFPISPETFTLISKKQAVELQVISFYRGEKEIRLATTDPLNPDIQEIAYNLKEKYFVDDVMIYMITQESFNHAFKLYETLPEIKDIIKGIEITEADINKYKAEISYLTDLQKKIKNVSVTEIVTAMIALGLQVEASDIHIEAEEEDVKVRYRIDGILNDAAVLPRETWAKITSRIKLLAELKLNITNKPQDGRFTIFLTKDQIDVRVSLIPTSYGESIVMRLLRSSATGFAFDDLGIRGRAFYELEKEMKKPNGMILTTGPTGSGKTTTLYAMINKLNTADTKIITLEDPIEYKLQGINQSQVDAGKGYTFPLGLRAILRQDPDVILVGEIRDLETADTAINAALTGHLVLSTLHTNSAAGCIPRLIAMGVKPFLLAPSLNAVIGQRLVRKICPTCKEEVELDTATMTQVMKILGKMPAETAAQIDHKDLAKLKFYKGGGCSECHGIGYKGRIGIYEVFTMTKEIEDLILTGQVSEYKMEDVATKQGMITMVQDGLLKASDAITTVEEVFRVAKSIES